MNTEKTTIGIMVFPETTGAVVYGMYDLFVSTGHDWSVITEGRPGRSLIHATLVAREPGLLTISNGVRISPNTSFTDCPPLDVICVPEVNLPPGTPLANRYAKEIEWLKERYRQGAILAAACSGAMLFAEAGLLDGWEATTHWAWCDDMRERFPAVKVREQQALVVTGEGQRLIMAGGGTSWMDLALYLIARLVGVEIAMQVARINLIDWHHIGQQPFARLARTRQVDDAVIARCQSWIAEHYDEPNPVNNMIRLSGLAERTFKRRFQQATGMSPLEYVHAMRLEEAKQMLESGDESFEAIANQVGYEDAGYFGRLFKRKVRLTPTAYRKRFGALRKSMPD
ncbi:helix-turn-helix domain-containing protein [Methylophaga sp.]|uniref:GlxA family transcriptional regulator n=1 Tax=Methylophaga sp. TaxID=2024840 RepID=UPI001400AA1B|nr:helix-turn-helix domain-containing protein [Methylophaga sp.]MTI63879.1 helix-turn-helix domain-containing protein [Methylophaga sp.]